MILKNKYGQRVFLPEQFRQQVSSMLQTGNFLNINSFIGSNNTGSLPPAKPSTEGADMFGKIKSKYPAMEALGDVTFKSDTSFTKEKTGAGSIETFMPYEGRDNITYDTGYSYQHPKAGTLGVVYNPNENTQQDIELDLLHGMSDVDPQYKTHRDNFKQAFMGSKYSSDLEAAWNDHESKYGTGDGKEQFINNEIDGHIRNLMFEGTDADFEKSNYWTGAREEYLSNPDISRSFSQLKHHLSYPKGYSLPEVNISP